jgi:hypothetical protein
MQLSPSFHAYMPSYMVSTTRNCTFPLAIRRNASFTFSGGYFSIIGRTPVISANCKVSSVSVGIPDAQPWMPLLP